MRMMTEVAVAEGRDGRMGPVCASVERVRRPFGEMDPGEPAGPGSRDDGAELLKQIQRLAISLATLTDHPLFQMFTGVSCINYRERFIQIFNGVDSSDPAKLFRRLKRYNLDLSAIIGQLESWEADRTRITRDSVRRLKAEILQL